jgi:phosphonate transport system permease protein
METTPAPRLAPLAGRPARARTSALVLDALLIAYAGWCAGYLSVRLGLAETSFLSRWPRLALVALPLALLWQVGDASLCQRAHRIERRGPGGGPATLDRRAFAGLLAFLEAALLLAPLLLLGAAPAGLALTLLVALALGVPAARDPEGRSWAERAAGLRTVFVPTSRAAPAAWHRRVNAWVVLVLLALTLTVGGFVTRLDLGELWSGAGRVRHVLGELVDPDWSIAGRVLELLVETVYVALLASLCALPFAFVLGFVAARNVTGGTALGRAVHGVTRLLLNLVRSVEPLIWAIVFSVWVMVGPFAGMLALWVHSVASLAKLYSEALEGVDAGPVEAIRSTGAGTLAVLRWGLLPQVVTAFLSFTVYRWDINVRMATILGLVGGGGIGNLLVDYTQLSAWSKLGTIVVFVTAVVWLLDVLSARARRRVG